MDKKENLNFEETIQELEKIVTELEKGNLNLEESVKKFEKGMQLAKDCNECLNNAEKRIQILIQKDGQMQEEKFELPDQA